MAKIEALGRKQSPDPKAKPVKAKPKGKDPKMVPLSSLGRC